MMRGRFGELLLLMPPLQNIARLMVDLVARYNQDTKQVDDLINEMLLSKLTRRLRLRRRKKIIVVLIEFLLFIREKNVRVNLKFCEFR